jgi:voltage-gated potassium channel
MTRGGPGEGRAATLALLGRLGVAVGALVGVSGLGAAGYAAIGGWTLPDGLYMAVSTVSGVGLGETLPGMAAMPAARAWTVALILAGDALTVVFASALTAFLVELDLGDVLRRRAMRATIEQMKDHVVVCGAGSTGIHVVEELRASGTPVVVIDRDPRRLDRLRAELGEDLPCVEGDATSDEVLEAAGIRRAAGLVASLHDDRDNLFVTVTARALAERLRIVSKATDAASVVKLERGGADVVVAPARIGGRRIASEIVRPTVVHLFDAVARDAGARDPAEPVLVEVPIAPGSRAAGRALGAGRFGKGRVLALRHPDGQHELDPGEDTLLVPGATLVVFGRAPDLAAVRAWCAGA